MDFISAWNSFFDKIHDSGFVVSFFLSVFSFTLLYYFVMKVLKKNNSSLLIWVMTAVVIFGGVIFVLNKELDGVFFTVVPLLMVVIIMSLFSVEVKRYVWGRKNNRTASVKHGNEEVLDEQIVARCIDDIIKALQDMAKKDIGALIVLSTGNIPVQILESGVKIKSDISSELIESIFFPKTPLHDGAMIINGTKIVAAGCFLPLSQNIDNIQKDLGTRHRAGLGITENIDVISLIVSEETGVISIAKGGTLTRFADTEILKKVLTNYYWEEIGGQK